MTPKASAMVMALLVPRALAGGPYVTTCHSDTECGTVCGSMGPDTVAFNEGSFGTKCECQDGSDGNLRYACTPWQGFNAWTCQDQQPPRCQVACGQTICIGKDSKYTNTVIRSACPQHHPVNVGQCCQHKDPAYCTCLNQFTADMNAAPYSALGGNNGWAFGAWWGACGSELHKLEISVDSERADRLVQPFLRNGTWCEYAAASNQPSLAQEEVRCGALGREQCSAGCSWCEASQEAGVASKCYAKQEADVLLHVLRQERGEGHFQCVSQAALQV